MNILIIGSGGREHALAWKIAKSPRVKNIFVAPGNGGTALEFKTRNVGISATDIQALIKFAVSEQIELVIVGPEAPLAAGIADAFAHHHIALIGPSKAASQIECSKIFAKLFMKRHTIPTADFAHFTQLNDAQDYIQSLEQFPLVIKADGLAAGKGVLFAHNKQEALRASKEMLLEKKFGGAGSAIIIEQFIAGNEMSFIVATDGVNAIELAPSRDYKYRNNGDKGPMTGGIGAYSPREISDSLRDEIMNRIIYPTIAAMAQEGRPFTGFLYAGLMIDNARKPHVLEFNCRLGDPETQVLLMRMKSDFVALCTAIQHKTLNRYQIDWDSRAAVGVVLTCNQYPESYTKGSEITFLTKPKHADCKVFHAGTTINNEGKIITNGGRVLCTTALGPTIAAAQAKAYELAELIQWQQRYYRTDIATQHIHY